MSRFDKENVGELAKVASRFRVDDSDEERRRAAESAPLLGKELKLLAALREAEEAYEEWLQLGPALTKVRQLVKNFPADCDRLKKNVEPVLARWSAMTQYGGDEEIACRVPNLKTREEVNAFICSVDRAMETLKLLMTAETGSEDERFAYRGSPGGKSNSSDALIAPLKEFTKVVRTFWLKEVSDQFGFDETTVVDETTNRDGRREPASAAARLIAGAAKILDARYDLGNVRHAMQSVRRDPQPY